MSPSRHSFCRLATSCKPCYGGDRLEAFNPADYLNPSFRTFGFRICFVFRVANFVFPRWGAIRNT